MKTIKKMMLAGLLAVAALAPAGVEAFSLSNVFAVAAKRFCENFYEMNCNKFYEINVAASKYALSILDFVRAVKSESFLRRVRRSTEEINKKRDKSAFYAEDPKEEALLQEMKPCYEYFVAPQYKELNMLRKGNCKGCRARHGCPAKLLAEEADDYFSKQMENLDKKLEEKDKKE